MVLMYKIFEKTKDKTIISDTNRGNEVSLDLSQRRGSSE